MKILPKVLILMIILYLKSQVLGIEKENIRIGGYSEFPLSNGIFTEYQFDDTYFFKVRYGKSPKSYMTSLGDILNNFSWWNSTYSSLLIELCTDMNGLELGFSTNTFLGKKNLIANIGVTLYTLSYNNLSNNTFNAIFGTSLENGRDLKVKGRLVALHFNLAKEYKLNDHWLIQPGINLNYIYSFYGSINSEYENNDSLSYKLNSWLRKYLEGLFLPTIMVEVKYQF